MTRKYSLCVAILWMLVRLSVVPLRAGDLPEGVPNPLAPDGKYTDAITFTTSAYRDEALKLMIVEANKVASELHLPDALPITKSNLVSSFVSPFGFAYVKKAIGNVGTSNYVYYISRDDKFCYLECVRQVELCRRYERDYMLPESAIDTNAAIRLATQWLSAVSVDVVALNRDSELHVHLDHTYVNQINGKIVPVYYVSWVKQATRVMPLASVRVFTPEKTLLQLRVEDPAYIHRDPLVFTNLAALLLGVGAPTGTNVNLQPSEINANLAHQRLVGQ
jgi:hypothetical protein